MNRVIDRVKDIIKEKDNDIKLLEEVLKIKYIDENLKQNIKHEIHALNTQKLVITEYTLELSTKRFESIYKELEGLSEV